MKLEVGKKYRMRDGGVVEITHTTPCPLWPFVGYEVGDEERTTMSFRVCGSFAAAEDEVHRFDLIAPLEDEDGWIPHKPGDPMPVDGDTMLTVRVRNGMKYSTKAAQKEYNRLISKEIEMTADLLSRIHEIDEDPELQAIRAILQAIEPLDDEAKERAVRYVFKRVVAE